MRKILIAILALLIVQVALAQNIAVENFQHPKHHFWQINSTLPSDKKNALVLFKTEQKGFEFKTAKDLPLETQETDEGILLKVPDKSKYIVISHPEFGDYAWRVPVKYLKKHNYYVADLVASDLSKEYKNTNQWVVFHISPEQSILTIDSVIHRISNGVLSLYLPIGTHYFQVESPFFEDIRDSLILTDSDKTEKYIYLQPFYSYLTVKAKDKGAAIFVDGQFYGSDEIFVGRIEEGNHRIALVKNDKIVKDTIVYVGAADKKTLIIPEKFESFNPIDLSGRKIRKKRGTAFIQGSEETKEEEKLIKGIQNTANIIAEIKLSAEDSLTLIKIDREPVGKGEWTGILEEGFHLITTERDGRTSVSQYIQITDDSPREINLVVPESSVGMVNIQSNVPGADILMDSRIIGTTPFLLKNLKADETHTLTLQKEGYKNRRVKVRPRNNDVIDLYVEMKKKR